METAPPQEISLDTCAESSDYSMAEVADGYYFATDRMLYYADKSDLTNWVLVCNQPDCKHEDEYCSACTGLHFSCEGGRIYSIRNPSRVGEVLVNATFVYSTALDGSDLRLEYEVPGTRIPGAGSRSSTLADNTVYGAYSILDTDGNFHNQFLRSTADATDILWESESEEMATCILISSNAMYGMRGDLAFLCNYWMEDDASYQSGLRRVKDSSLEEIPGLADFSEEDLMGAYLDGDTFCHFRANDGYYATDLSTGTSRKLQDAQLENSRATYFTQRLAVETNLYYGNTPEQPELRFFDGAQFHTVALPEGFAPSEDAVLRPLALSTEYLFFTLWMDKQTSLYAMPLNGSSYALTLCATF